MFSDSPNRVRVDVEEDDLYSEVIFRELRTEIAEADIEAMRAAVENGESQAGLENSEPGAPEDPGEDEAPGGEEPGGGGGPGDEDGGSGGGDGTGGEGDDGTGGGSGRDGDSGDVDDTDDADDRDSSETGAGNGSGGPLAQTGSPVAGLIAAGATVYVARRRKNASASAEEASEG
ncbi:hypothetical protein [Nocardiopsis deserti]|uniref:hypothetical protein n=1 Tax=Nocardiopsis deserti TaxID=2605988 RepID=UPI001CC24560|nr:hypothetical protein [Nocardiopsis deserti]